MASDSDSNRWTSSTTSVMSVVANARATWSHNVAATASPCAGSQSVVGRPLPSITIDSASSSCVISGRMPSTMVCIRPTNESPGAAVWWIVR